MRRKPNGFAQIRDVAPEYRSLREDLVWAAMPGGDVPQDIYGRHPTFLGQANDLTFGWKGPYGVAAACLDLSYNDLIHYPRLDKFGEITTQFTIAALVGFVSSSTGGAGTIFNATIASPQTYGVALRRRQGGDEVSLLWRFSTNTLQINSGTGIGIAGTRDRPALISCSRNLGQYRFWSRGKQFAAPTNATAQTESVNWISGANLFLPCIFNSFPGQAVGFEGNLSFVAVWKRELSAAEHYRLWRDPFGMFRTRRRVWAGASFPTPIILEPDAGDTMSGNFLVEWQAG